MFEEALRSIPRVELGELDLSVLRPGQTVVVEAVDQFGPKKNRLIEITLTMTTIARFEVVRDERNSPEDDLRVLRCANLSIVNKWVGRSRAKDRDLGEEFGVW